MKPTELASPKIASKKHTPRMTPRRKSNDKDAYSPGRRGVRNFRNCAYKENFPIRKVDGTETA